MDNVLSLLVIEDELTDFLLLERHLQKQGMAAQLQRVANADELSMALRQGHWDIVLSDYNIPGLNFNDSLELLRTVLPNAPIILLSGAVGEEKAIELLRRGIADFLLKDNLARLVPSIERAVREARELKARQAAERELRNKDQLLREISALARIGGWELEAESGRCLCTGEIASIYECEMPPGMSLDRFVSFFSDESRQRFSHALAEALEHATPFDLELEIVSGKRSRKWVRVVANALCHGKVADKIRASIQDITASKSNALALIESEQRFRYATQATNDVIWDWNVAKNTIWWSDGIERVFGFARDVVAPSYDFWMQRIHPQDRERVVARLTRVITGGDEHWADEYRFLRADGEYVFVVDQGSVVRDSQGYASRMVGSMTDVTARKQYEEKLQQQAALLDEATDAIIVRSLEDQFLYWNKAAERQYGWKAEEVLGRPIMEVLYSVSRVTFAEALAILKERGDFSGRIIHTRKDGSNVTVQSHWVLVRNADGSPKSILAIHTDLTHQLQLEERLFQSQKLEALGQLTGGIAHDFNNLLTVIIGSAEALREELQPDRNLSGLARTIESAAEKGAELTGRLLAFARRQTLQPKVVNPTDIVESMRELLKRTLGEQIRLGIAGASGGWTTFADPVQLESAILNLCINARDAMPNGGDLSIEIVNVRLGGDDIVHHPDVIPGDYVKIVVSDNGSGMSTEVWERAFEPFFTTKKEIQRTGLGLSMVYGFIKQSRGHVEIASTQHKGTAISLYLPRSTATPSGSKQEGLVRTEASAGECVLLVEDNELVRNHGIRLLHSLGYRVIAARSGGEALALLQQGLECDLLFTDVVMPGGINGPELAEAARRLNPRLPVIYTSGFTDNALVPENEAPGEIRLLRKPYRRESLAAMLRAALKKK